MDLRRKKLVGTLVFPVRDGQVLLARKVRKIGIGLWNGWGGERENETVRQCALREFQDESGCLARLDDLEYVGRVIFHNQKRGKKFDVEVHMFLLHHWEGEPKPRKSEMIEPTFWPIQNLPPAEEFMPSDLDWLPYVLAGTWVEGETWQKWIEEEGKPARVVLTKPSRIMFATSLGDVD